MAHKKKKPDCLVAGVLALLTAFSPVVSVIPTYAASDNEMSTSVTIDNDPSPDIDSGGGSDGSDGSDGSGTAGVVIDNSDSSDSSQSSTGQSDISIEGDQGDGIVSETIGDTTGTDGIQVEDSGDGIQVEKGQDGDGILIDPSSLSGNDVQVEQTGESISVDQAMNENTESHALRFDFVGEHGLVKVTSKSGSATYDTRYIRVHENADGNKIASIYDKDRNLIYTSEVSNYVAFYQDSLPEGDAFTVEAIADYGYSVGTYSILMDSGAEDQEDVFDQTGFIADHYQKYTWDVVMNTDKSMRIAFTDSEDLDLEYENSIGLVNPKTIIDDTMQNTVSENSVSEDETDGQGFIVLSEDPTEEGHEVISSMADEVELPEITEKEEEQAIADPIYEGYIRDNLNLDLVGKYDYLGPISTMRVKQSLYDNNALFDRTDIDDLMTDFNYPDYFLMQFETVVPIYAVNDDTDYLVAYVNTMQQDSRARIMDWDFAENNFDGILLDDCIYDKDTGLAYIPRHNIMEGDNYYLDKIQVQLAQAIDFNAKYTESVAMAGSSEDVVTADACSMFEEYPTFDVGADMDESSLEVYMNGLPIDKEFYQYDSSNGILTINHSPAIVSSVYVKGEQSKSLLSSFLSTLFGLKSVKAVDRWTDMKSLGTATTKSGLDDLRPGNLLNARGAYVYGGIGDLIANGYNATNDESKYYCYVTSTDNGAAATLANWIIDGGACPVNQNQVRLIRNSDGEINFQMDINSITSPDGVFDFSELDLDSDCYIPMRCSHIGAPLGNGTGAWPQPTICVGNTAIKMRVVATGHDNNKNTDYAILALMTQQVTIQSGVGLFRVDVEKKGLELRVNKNIGTSTHGLCVNHPRYDMKGGVFGVYRTSDAAENANIIDSVDDNGRDNMVLGSVNCKNYWQGKGELIGTLATKNDVGMTGVLKLDRLYNDNGRLISDFRNGLYVRELKAPLGYDLNFEVVHVTLPNRLNGDEDVITVPIVDPPLSDPGALDIVKVPEDSFKTDMSRIEFMQAMANNPEDMNGAEYELRFYKKYPNLNLILNEENADVVCHLKTTTIDGFHGRLDLSDPNCYVKGSKWPWVNGRGEPVMPMGIYTLEETKAPPNYELKKNKMKIIGNCYQRDVTEADGTKHFTARFNWQVDKWPGNNAQEVRVPLRENELGVAFAWNEPVSYANVGIYKRDKDDELFKTGDKPGNLTFDGIEFGLIYGEENTEPGHNYKGDEIAPGHEVPGVKLVFKDGKSYATTEDLNKGQGVVSPGIYYFIETKGNDVYLKSEDRLKIVVPTGGEKATVYFPGKDGNGIPASEALDDKGEPTDAVQPFENISPPMGVELDKTTWTNFGEMKSDDYILGDATYKDYIFGKQDIGDATLEGHTFAIFHTSENDIELKDGTKVKSAKDKLEDPDNPTWKELNNLYELTEGKIQENGYICDLIVTDEKGEAKTAPDAFSIGTYWVIEVATKEDYVVNNVDVGKVGGKEGVKADQLTKDGGLIKAVFEHNGETADDGACWNPPVSGGVHIQKLDEMRDDDREHGDLNLAATFKIINASKKAVKNKYGETIPTSGLTDKPHFPTYDQVRAASETCTVYEITADKNGKADTEEHDLVYGTYYIIETAVPDGYYLNTEWVGKVEIRKDGEIVPVGEANNELHDEYNHYYYDRSQKEPVVHPDDAVACRDMPYRGGVAVQKIDKEMGWQTAQGMGTLKGAEFTILNASGSSARNVDGKDVKSVTSRKDFQETYQQLWRIANETDSPYVMQRIYTNKEGFACTDKFDLPYGTYYIIETKAPVGYWLDEEFVGKIVIRDDGRCMMMGDDSVEYEVSFDIPTHQHIL